MQGIKLFAKGKPVMIKFKLTKAMSDVGSNRTYIPAGTVVELHGVSMGSDLDDANTEEHNNLVLWTALATVQGRKKTWLLKRKYDNVSNVAQYLGKVTLNKDPDVSKAVDPKATPKVPIANRINPTICMEDPALDWPKTSVSVNWLFPSTNANVASDVDISAYTI